VRRPSKRLWRISRSAVQRAPAPRASWTGGPDGWARTKGIWPPALFVCFWSAVRFFRRDHRRLLLSAPAIYDEVSVGQLDRELGASAPAVAKCQHKPQAHRPSYPMARQNSKLIDHQRRYSKFSKRDHDTSFIVRIEPLLLVQRTHNFPFQDYGGSVFYSAKRVRAICRQLSFRQEESRPIKRQSSAFDWSRQRSA